MVKWDSAVSLMAFLKTEAAVVKILSFSNLLATAAGPVCCPVPG